MNGAGRSRRIQRIVGTVVALAATGFFVAYAVRNFQEIPALHWQGASPAIAVLSVALAVLVTMIGGCIWLRLLKDSGVSVSWTRAQVIFSIAQFAKYLPGNVGQFIGRVFLANEAGIPVPVTIGTMLIEFVWLVGVAGTLGLVAVLRFLDGSALGGMAAAGPIGITLLIVVAVLAPWATIRFVNTYLPGLARRASVAGRIPEPRPSSALLVGVFFLACFFITGLVLKMQAQWFFRVADVSLLELTSLFAIAWIAGYVTPGAPGGLGVREAIMVLLLPPVVGIGAAVGLGITLRIATTLGDLVAFVAGTVMRRHLSKSESAHGPL